MSAENLPDPHHISHRRKIGAYYTPIEVTRLLCEWGVRSKTDRILEPCFGGCTFLEAALEELDKNGQAKPNDYLYGCDIDPLAFQFLQSRLGGGVNPTHFFQVDFLRLKPNQGACQNIDFVVGNPPYIRHDNLDNNQKLSVKHWKEENQIILNGRASLWSYFLLHSLSFLQKGGRIAFVLPGSYLTAHYAHNIRKLIETNFSAVVTITLTKRLFVSEGTEELTIILLAEGYKTNSTSVETVRHCYDSLEELGAFIRSWRRCGQHKPSSASSQIGTGMLPQSAVDVLEKLGETENVKKLGEVSVVRIGLVAGDKGFFIKSPGEWKRFGIEKRHLKYIAPRSLWMQGVQLTPGDAAVHENMNIPCLALDGPSNPRAKSLLAYLDTYPIEKRKNNSTFGRREIWHRFLEPEVPDAFMVFMTDFGPRLILNKTRATCTNSLYRVSFKSLTETEMRLVVISFFTTYTQLSAELLGHGRGSGALKLEPSDAAKLPLYLPARTKEEVNAAFKELDKIMRHQDFDSVIDYADNFIMSDSKIFSESLPILKYGLAMARMRRMRESLRRKYE